MFMVALKLLNGHRSSACHHLAQNMLLQSSAVEYGYAADLMATKFYGANHRYLNWTHPTVPNGCSKLCVAAQHSPLPRHSRIARRSVARGAMERNAFQHA